MEFQSRFSRGFRGLSLFLCFTFIITFAISPTPGDAQVIPQLLSNLPAPGMMVGLSPEFTPPIVRGLTIRPDNPFQFDFIIDTGDDNLQGEAFRNESEKLIKYFLASLTVPDQDFWVNLSPVEKDRIVGKGLGETHMGLDMLAQDYMLKQLTASLMYPEEELGQRFWKRVHQKVRAEYGNVNVPTDAFHKVWIVPDQAHVYEHNGSAFVVERHLKVMLEHDYFALQNNQLRVTGNESRELKTSSLVTRHSSLQHNQSVDIDEIIRQIIIPAIEHEVNHGKNFAQLRQIYNSMILATWYKQALKNSLLNQVYSNQNKVKGINIDDKAAPEKVYAQYMEAFHKGVYNYIREDVDSATNQIIPRQYFSGGLTRVENLNVSSGPLTDQARKVQQAVMHPESKEGQDQRVTWRADQVPADQITADPIQEEGLKQPETDSAMLSEFITSMMITNPGLFLVLGIGLSSGWYAFRKSSGTDPKKISFAPLMGFAAALTLSGYFFKNEYDVEFMTYLITHPGLWVLTGMGIASGLTAIKKDIFETKVENNKFNSLIIAIALVSILATPSAAALSFHKASPETKIEVLDNLIALKVPPRNGVKLMEKYQRLYIRFIVEALQSEDERVRAKAAELLELYGEETVKEIVGDKAPLDGPASTIEFKADGREDQAMLGSVSDPVLIGTAAAVASVTAVVGFKGLKYVVKNFKVDKKISHAFTVAVVLGMITLFGGCKSDEDKFEDAYRVSNYQTMKEILAKQPDLLQLQNQYVGTSVQVGNVTKVKFLLDHGADPNSIFQGKNLLMWAIEGPSPNEEIAFELIKRGAEIPDMVKDKAIILYSIEKKWNRLLAFLVEKGAVIDQETVVSAINMGNFDAIKIISKKDVNVDVHFNGTTPLIAAVNNNDIDRVKMLVEEYGADVNFSAVDGATPLIAAVKRNNVRMVEYLEEKKANPQQKNKDGQSALDIAKLQKLDIIRLILEGIDLSVESDFALGSRIRFSQALTTEGFLEIYHQFIDSSDPLLKRAAIEAFEEILAKNDKVLEELNRILKDETRSYALRVSAALAIGQIVKDPGESDPRQGIFTVTMRPSGEGAVSSLVALLKDPEAKDFREKIIYVLGDIGLDASSAVRDIVEIIEAEETSKKIKVEGVIAIGKIGSDEDVVIPVLSNLAKGNDEDLAVNAVKALNKIGPMMRAVFMMLESEEKNPSLKLLAEALFDVFEKSPYLEVRRIASFGLLGIANQVDNPKSMLIKGLGSEDAEIRFNVAKAIGLFAKFDKTYGESLSAAFKKENHLQTKEMLVQTMIQSDYLDLELAADDFYFYRVCLHGKAEDVEKLISANANVNVKGERGEPGLLVLAMQKQIDVMEVLLRHGSDPDVKAPHEITTLMTASFSGDLPIVKLLVKYNANLNLKAKTGDTALDFAKRKGYSEVVKFLESVGAKTAAELGVKKDGAMLGDAKNISKVMSVGLMGAFIQSQAVASELFLSNIYLAKGGNVDSEKDITFAVFLALTGLFSYLYTKTEVGNLMTLHRGYLHDQEESYEWLKKNGSEKTAARIISYFKIVPYKENRDYSMMFQLIGELANKDFVPQLWDFFNGTEKKTARMHASAAIIKLANDEKAIDYLRKSLDEAEDVYQAVIALKCMGISGYKAFSEDVMHLFNNIRNEDFLKEKRWLHQHKFVEQGLRTLGQLGDDRWVSTLKTGIYSEWREYNFVVMSLTIIYDHVSKGIDVGNAFDQEIKAILTKSFTSLDVFKALKVVEIMPNNTRFMAAVQEVEKRSEGHHLRNKANAVLKSMRDSAMLGDEKQSEERKAKADSSDQAALVQPGASTKLQDADGVGGIDFNPQGLELIIKRDGNGIPLPLPQQPVELMYIEGLTPIIINVVPANIPMILGLKEEDEILLAYGS